MPTVSYITANGRLSATVVPSGGTTTLLPDALGNVVRTRYEGDPDAGLALRYSPHGRLAVRQGRSDLPLPSFGWVGGPGYRITNLAHVEHYVRKRHVSTTEGRWTTVDPLWP